MMSLVFVDEWESGVRAAVEAMFAALQVHHEVELPEGTVNVKLVSDPEIAILNQQFSGNAYATDVLTFNYAEAVGDIETPDDNEELADIAVSRETALRQATEAKTPLADEVALLVLHGLLHVIGHDHAEHGDRVAMDELQSAILEDAGLTYRNFAWTE